MKRLHTLPAVACVFLIAVILCFILSGVGSGENTIVRSVPEEELLRGGDDPDTDYAEMLPGEKININTADADELTKLPGIGDTLAENIITYREENGDFDDIEEITEVTGIGEGRYDNIRSLIETG